MRAVWAALLAGCSFHPGEAGKDAPADTPLLHDVPGDAIRLDSPPASCQVTDSSLVLCLELDEPGLGGAATARDDSGKHHNPAIANLGIASRNVPATSQAAALSVASTMTIPANADFDLQHFTVSAWVKRNASGEMGVVDVGKQYTMSISSTNGEVECAVSSATLTTGFTGGSSTAQNEWDLVACTYDGTNFCSYSFRNGSNDGQEACTNYNQAIDINIGFGEAIGEWVAGASHFTGTLDQVRVYGRALSQQELCMNGGISGC